MVTVLLLQWCSAGALLPREGHLHMTVRCGYKTDGDVIFLCRIKEPAVLQSITVGSYFETGSDLPATLQQHYCRALNLFKSSATPQGFVFSKKKICPILFKNVTVIK